MKKRMEIRLAIIAVMLGLAAMAIALGWRDLSGDRRLASKGETSNTATALPEDSLFLRPDFLYLVKSMEVRPVLSLEKASELAAEVRALQSGIENRVAEIFRAFDNDSGAILGEQWECVTDTPECAWKCSARCVLSLKETGRHLVQVECCSKEGERRVTCQCYENGHVNVFTKHSTQDSGDVEVEMREDGTVSRISIYPGSTGPKGKLITECDSRGVPRETREITPRDFKEIDEHKLREIQRDMKKKK